MLSYILKLNTCITGITTAMSACGHSAALTNHNSGIRSSYGNYSTENAWKLARKDIKPPVTDVHFVMSGMLVNTALTHKITMARPVEGKLTPDKIVKVCKRHKILDGGTKFGALQGEAIVINKPFEALSGSDLFLELASNVFGIFLDEVIAKLESSLSQMSVTQ
ncbi:uncharacterized protein CLUP02_06300 [Colletotrichum lupini]|uniref:Uncharacterized protein n=1 Tax=Colletotrichum lupini TaxID=145971 RepID=A0A9Q8SPR0_9PEZI|nr:uncharacterized protein CLUP02_06300 [Colletotrichum lupini]UQC80815.1 hypothetical protein CLUP02_06300 [Colletotrichum lupini]